MRIRLTKQSIEALAVPGDKVQLLAWDTEQRGLGIVVGKAAKTFVVDGRVNGKKRRVVLGRYPEMNVVRARAAAQKRLGEMRVDGIDRNEERRERKSGPTLRDALGVHVDAMRKRGRSQRSIDQIEREVVRYWSEWLDRPLVELGGEDVAKVHDRIKAEAQPRANAVNAPGAAQANRAVVYLSACWNAQNRMLQGKLGTWNPAKAVVKDTLRPKRVRIADATLPDWYARVQTMKNPVQRDGLLLALFTGLRSEDVRTIRWENFDAKAKSLLLPDPKGGAAKAFTLPLSKTCVDLLKRRAKENAVLCAEVGGDGGWAFPGFDRKGKVIPITDLREQREGEGEDAPKVRFPAEDVHTLRRTYESVAHEVGISELDLHCLTNHSFASHNVNAQYIAQQFEHLATCQAAIERALWKRIGVRGREQRPR